MIRENQRKEKICLFFASDYHFEMISLPYINESLKKDKKVIIVTENDLNKTVNKLLSSINLKEEEKNKITQIDWKNDDLNKLKQIEQANKQNEETIIFVKGKEEYIDNINKSINSCNNVEVINCYDINKVNNNVSEIAKKYSKVLSTFGVENLL